VSRFPPDLSFIYEWRTYQRRVLEELEDHMGDSHLHVVAAPGAGKTVLGLEVVRRLNKKTLVLVPTLTVRNQWLHHFENLFQTQAGDKQALISDKLLEPAHLTVSTYQSLHSASNNHKIGISALAQFDTLVLDEAHHLRNEWWKVLIEFKKQLNDVNVVALTATPPYDVPPREWNRYFEMCGPIDSIISVPELVKEGNLCPHEDFVYFSLPSEPEQKKIRTFRRQVKEIKEWLLDSRDFSRALLGHTWFSNFEADQNQIEILEQPEVFAAHVIFLHALGHDCKAQIELLGMVGQKIPDPTDEWFEVLLSDMVSKHSDRYDFSSALKKDLQQRLATMHAMNRRKVQFTEHEGLDKSLRNSESKLKSTLEIFELENRHLGKELRMVILTDYIRKDFLESHSHSGKSRRLGAVPIFELIREKYGSTVPIALLTGSLIILPKSRTDEFLVELQKRDARIQAPRAIPLLSDAEYVLLKLDHATRQLAVGAVTDMFNLGHLRTIVGTTALLGEGWDAPATNTLVMASASSTYVQTNQVRGRAIRVNPNVPNKISNIWHLACIEPESYHGGSDFLKIKNRFSAFEGLSYEGNRILSGFQRIFPVPEKWTIEQVAKMNAQTLELSAQRQKIKEGWDKVLAPQAHARQTGLVEEIQAGSQSIMALQLVEHPLKRSLQPTIVLGAYFLVSIFALPFLGLGLVKAGLLHTVLLGGLIYKLALHHLAKDWFLVLKLGEGPLVLGRVAEVVLETLCELEMIRTPFKQLELTFLPDRNGKSVCYVRGCTLYESDLFIRCMEEILDPVENPRYLIFRPNTDRRKASLGEGYYHGVPSALSKKKQAEVLTRNWQKKLGNCKLIYTRLNAGRKVLLKARTRAWVNLHKKITFRQSVWK